MTESTQNKHVTDCVGDLIQRLNNRSDNQVENVYDCELLAKAADKLEELFDAYIDLEVKSAMRIHELEEELKTTKKKLEDYRDLDCLLCK